MISIFYTVCQTKYCLFVGWEGNLVLIRPCLPAVAPVLRPVLRSNSEGGSSSGEGLAKAGWTAMLVGLHSCDWEHKKIKNSHTQKILAPLLSGDYQAVTNL